MGEIRCYNLMGKIGFFGGLHTEVGVCNFYQGSSPVNSWWPRISIGVQSQSVGAKVSAVIESTLVKGEMRETFSLENYRRFFRESYFRMGEVKPYGSFGVGRTTAQGFSDFGYDLPNVRRVEYDLGFYQEMAKASEPPTYVNFDLGSWLFVGFTGLFESVLQTVNNLFCSVNH